MTNASRESNLDFRIGKWRRSAEDRGRQRHAATGGLLIRKSRLQFGKRRTRDRIRSRVSQRAPKARALSTLRHSAAFFASFTLPKPPPPGVSITNTSPGFISVLLVEPRSVRPPSARRT